MVNDISNDQIYDAIIVGAGFAGLYQLICLRDQRGLGGSQGLQGRSVRDVSAKTSGGQGGQTWDTHTSKIIIMGRLSYFCIRGAS